MGDTHRTTRYRWEDAPVGQRLRRDAVIFADRADYLLRDSHHAGVAYGRFDHHRLVDTLRVLRAPGTGKPTIGIERGGMHAAEGLQLARYFMFEQLYYHRVRRALDLHLREFLRAILPGAVYPRRSTSISA